MEISEHLAEHYQKGREEALLKVKLEFRHAYNKCKQELGKIKSQKPRENNTPKDWEQRIDEILLIYSAIFNVSFNDARSELDSQDSSKEKSI